MLFRILKAVLPRKMMKTRNNKTYKNNKEIKIIKLRKEKKESLLSHLNSNKKICLKRKVVINFMFK